MFRRLDHHRIFFKQRLWHKMFDVKISQMLLYIWVDLLDPIKLSVLYYYMYKRFESLKPQSLFQD